MGLGVGVSSQWEGLGLGLDVLVSAVAVDARVRRVVEVELVADDEAVPLEVTGAVDAAGAARALLLKFTAAARTTRTPNFNTRIYAPLFLPHS